MSRRLARAGKAIDREIVVASNRGPVSLAEGPHGELVARRGGGGLVTALTGALQRSGGLWVASGMSEEDRRQASRGHLVMEPEETQPAVEGLEPSDERFAYQVRYLAFEEPAYDGFYNGVSNEILWFLHHRLWDIPRSPRFGRETRTAWNAYREVSEGFASALDEEGSRLRHDPAYLVQDYHLSLVPAMLRKRRSDARIVHFSHIPFAGPGYLSVLPGWMREELLTGLLGADVVGFQADTWAESFLTGCRTLPGTSVDLRRRRLRWEGRSVLVGVYPISIDVEHLVAASRSEEVARARRELLRWKGDRKLVLRVDRTDLSKNILRGFLAYEAFLRRNDEWRGKVVFLALLNPSRQDVPEYGDYMRDCLLVVERINEQLGEEGWQPIDVAIQDDFPRAVAAYGAYDVLMVNPVFDGMNLVAKEGPMLNKRSGVLILSENAGAHAELGRHAIGVNPFDIEATAQAIGDALEMDELERARRARGMKAAIRRNRLDDWVERQLDDLERATGARQG